MHQIGAHGLLTIIKYMYLLYGHIAFVHIVKLYGIVIQQQVAHGYRIVARVVAHIGLHHTRHCQVEWFLGAVALHLAHLLEVAQLTCIVGHSDDKLLAHSHFLGEFHVGTSAIGLYALYHQSSQTLVSQFERGGDRLFVTRSSHINRGVLNRQPLSINGEKVRR